MILREAVITDVKNLKHICVNAYTQNFKHHWQVGGLEWYLQREFSLERLQTDLKDESTHYYFIEHDLNVVGFIKTKNLLPENAIELEKIYILPEFKGAGIGKLALTEIIKQSKESGCKNLYLSVIDTNTNAIAFYLKLGFALHEKTRLELPYFKEELKGMHRMLLEL